MSRYSGSSVESPIETDTAILNQNLAEFYGVPDVFGPAFRPVEVPREQGRGGLLSQGAFLVGHSDGVHPHPIKRAVWVKERILGDPPPPPPAGIQLIIMIFPSRVLPPSRSGGTSTPRAVWRPRKSWLDIAMRQCRGILTRDNHKRQFHGT